MQQVTENLYPKLRAYLSLKGLPLKAAFTTQEVADMFDVTPRAIQYWISKGRLKRRNVPGRAKIFPEDLEALLAASDPSQTTDSQHEPQITRLGAPGPERRFERTRNR